MAVIRSPYVVVLLLSSCLIATLATGVTYAASSRSSSFKACADPSGQLALLSKQHKCAKGYSEVTLGASGPKGDRGATGAAGPVGPTGASGATGATGAQGARGDTGLQGPKGDTGLQGPKGDAGATGSTGAAGPPGAAGANGNTILNGSGAPSDSVGAVGDFYLDTTNELLYGPKVGEGCNPLPCRSAWPVSGTSLRGAPGASGQGPAYEADDGDKNLPNGNTTTLTTQTIPVAGDYTVIASVQLNHDVGGDTSWDCTLDAANPGHSSITLATAVPSLKGQTVSEADVPLIGVVSIAAQGTISVTCTETLAQQADDAAAQILTTQVSSLTTTN
jgi:Collagen triple helix repeat (20 copies)